MSVTDAQFRIGVAAGGVILVAAISLVRFCGPLSLPSKPSVPAPNPMTSQLASPVVYQDFLLKDAKYAGVPVPSLAEMSRKLTFQADDGRHVLKVGKPAVSIAGLQLSAQKKDRTLVLQIRNVTDSALAYNVRSTPAPNSSACASARSLGLNAMVIAGGETLERVECVWRNDVAIVVTRVETAAVGPLQAWYLSMVPPSQVGIEARISNAHQAPAKSSLCGSTMAQSIRMGLEKGQIAWRDLIDFYARHPCKKYQFPSSYRALKADGERPIPASEPGR